MEVEGARESRLPTPWEGVVPGSPSGSKPSKSGHFGRSEAGVGAPAAAPGRGAEVRVAFFLFVFASRCGLKGTPPGHRCPF